MPKEVVYGQWFVEAREGTAQDPDRVMVPLVEVGWSRDAEYVQLVTKCEKPPASSPIDTGPIRVPETALIRDGEEVVGVAWPTADPTEAETSAMYAGFYVDLNRDGINRLIRNLRRARDQAYGKDE